VAFAAIELLNEAGGVNGRVIVPVFEDVSPQQARESSRLLTLFVLQGKSDPPTFAARAEKLISVDGVAAIFGCWTSSSRKAVLPVVEAHNR
jgi:urea transport system substrate-binding protein